MTFGRLLAACVAAALFSEPHGLRKRRSIARTSTASSGNRGTGLATGEWVVDGGVNWNGIDVDVSFEMFFKINSISDDTMNIDAHETSDVVGERLPEGGYPNLELTYQRRVHIGLWTYRNGYLLEQRLCTVAGNCLEKIFIPEGQSKWMVMGDVEGLTAWVTSNNDAREAAAAKLSGNRGTGLVAGEWVVDGGMTWNGIDVDVAFEMFFKINSISEDSMIIDAHETSDVAGERLPEGGYPNLELTYQRRVNIGLWTYRNGYLLEQRLCTVAGNCLDKIFIPEGQSKWMVMGEVEGITAWVTSKNDAREAGAAMLSNNR